MGYFVVFLTGFVGALLLTPFAMRISRRWGIVAVPGGRRKHQGSIPTLGGLALVGAYLTAVFVATLVFPPTTPDDALRLRGVILGTLVMVIGGLIDDRYELSARWQLFFQFMGTAVAMNHIVFIEVFSNPFKQTAIWTDSLLHYLFRVEGDLIWMWRPLALLVTLIWIVGMINAVNMLDGLDGLATGVGTIAALLFAWHSYRLGQTAVAAYPLALAGALIGFLLFNFAPAKIFLGAAGASLLGYNLATYAILSPAKLSTALLVLSVPILDVAWQIISRLRRGQSPFHGDRGHLHFRLSDRGLPTRRIVLGYYVVTAAFGLIAIVAPTGLLKLGLLLGWGTAVLLFLAYLGRKQAT